ncbi:GntP family permease [Dyadobacter sediminis]|uniref:GntP family permease n=1 Tax=Dyadobacter sediminis TaxID=1493691 RepID=A0A5R9KEN8_9BACT|nr:GntP family permease [Dyadobacter sediminis]TLU94526.1 GntP family permease [Dyadobacter sediminis]GGB90468.1 gluconate transporter [Dyadobacter sediminis]
MIIIIVLAAIIFIVLSSTVLKMHPLTGLLLAALGVGVFAGLPIDKLAETIGKGFGELMSKIGLMVILGCVIGAILDKSGAAIKVADVILKLFGEKRPAFAMSVIGGIVGIPVFCDSGFIILHKLNQIVANRTGKPLGTIALSLSGGLFATHTLVPPTPGPLSAAGNLGIADSVGLVILLGLIVSVPSLFLSTWFAGKYARNMETAESSVVEEPVIIPERQLPSAWKSFMPILLPIILITLASFARILNFPDVWIKWFGFFGSPLVSFLLAIFFSYSLFPEHPAEKMTACFKSGIEHCGTTLVLVGAGGAFGAILKETSLKEIVSLWLINNEMSGSYLLLIAFVIAAFFKTAQGSTTSSMVLTTSILAPLLGTLGFVTPVQITLIVMAVGSGAMIVSHTNDAWFWVVSQFTGISTRDTYRTHTILTGLQGLASFAVTMMLWFLLS